MSFISVFAKENFVSVMSDGLVVDLRTGEEKEQRYQKFKKISKDQFVAIGGNQGLSEKVIEVIGYQDEERELLPIATPIRSQIIDEVSPDMASCQVVLGGIEDNAIVFYYFNNDPEQSLERKEPKGDKLEYVFLSTSVHGINLDQELMNLNNTQGLGSSTKVLKAQKKLNDLVAENDSSVNKITFNLAIRK